MSKPTSSLTSAITIRIPNDLLNAVVNHAMSQGFLNEAGRMDKRGQPNLSATVTNLLKQALDHAKQETSSEPVKVYDSVSISQKEALDIKLASIENTLVNRVRDVVAQQLNNFFSDYSTSIVNTVEHKMESTCQTSNTEDTEESKEDTKERILQAASRGFRSRGYHGIGVNTLAKDAGVTSGAFYGYFRSKEDAFLTTVVAGLAEYRNGIETFRANYGANWSVALADYYLGRPHREDLACGCALPTLAPEVVRGDRRVRTAYQTELIKLNEAIAAGLVNGNTKEKQDQAWVILALLSGGVTLARSVWDEDLAQQIATAIHQATIQIASGILLG